MEPHAGVEARDESTSDGSTYKPLIGRYFTDEGVDPLDQINWVKRTAWAGTKYEHVDVEAPDFWSDNAVAITSKLYLAKGKVKEDSVRRLVNRLRTKITAEGAKADYLSTLEEEDAFYSELGHILINQLAVFNSPVLFNVGRPDRAQQVSACFILSVDDTTDSIKSTSGREIDIFRGGSGSGFSVSRMRGSMEPLSTGGTSSGPVSFMRLWDAGAGTFKSGGVTRRAAKLVECDVDHPDIRYFITCKAEEEDRIQALADAGFNVSMDEEGERLVAESTSFQNANNSVGVSDEFMTRALDQFDHSVRNWPLIARSKMWRDQHNGESIVSWESCSELLELMAKSARRAACPGIFFLDAINRMHTTPMIDGLPSPIESSNPCGEFLSNNNTSCNLGSVNILKFVREDGSFDVRGFEHVVDVMFLSMDILITLADYPDEVITHMTRSLRQVGLGYSNMGAAIMAQGLAYDSDEARDFAASVTALLTGRCYRKSAELAERLGAFDYFAENREVMLGVINRHHGAIPDDQRDNGGIWDAADFNWRQAISGGIEHGFRNAQATVIPPAGTTSYFLDCDTTGIEPAFELVIHKEMAGGGSMTIANQSVERGLQWHHTDSQVEYLLKVLSEDGSEAFMRDVNPSAAPVFHGAGQISPEAHLKMVAAVQPFVSGSISKTINMHSESTWEDVRDAYILAWKLGLKNTAIYRDGSKARQPHKAKVQETEELTITGKQVGQTTIIHHDGLVEGDEDVAAVLKPYVDLMSKGVGGEPQAQVQISPPPRHYLPRTRRALTHKIHLRGPMGDYKGYVHAGMYDDGRLAELFIEGFGRAGSFTLNALGRWGTSFSKAIQYGIPWEDFARDSLGVADETGGMVVPDPNEPNPGPPAIRSSKSVFDYIVRWLALEFGDDDLREEFGVRVGERREVVDDGNEDVLASMAVVSSNGDRGVKINLIQGPQCPECGNHMRPTGGCFTCSCGHNTGCG